MWNSLSNSRGTTERTPTRLLIPLNLSHLFEELAHLG
jgi:hypothetical protein